MNRAREAAEVAWAAHQRAQDAHCAALDRIGIVRASFGERAASIRQLFGRGLGYNQAAEQLAADVDERLAPLKAEAERLGLLRAEAREALRVARAAWVAAGKP